MTTPTAALVEEAERMAVRALDGTASREEKSVLFASLASALRRAEAERDALAAANVAANKRIVELEQETDRLITQRDRWEEQVGDMAASAGCEEEFSNWHDHKDCVEECVAVLKTERDAARTELARLTTPRPIAEAPRDGTWIVGFWEDAPPKIVRRWAEQWRDYMGAPVAWRTLTHYLPLPAEGDQRTEKAQP